jgi:hypothetical protein
MEYSRALSPSLDGAIKRAGKINTIGYNYAEISGTTGCRNPSRDYSQQYKI